LTTPFIRFPYFTGTFGRQLAVGGLCIALLSGCATTKKVAAVEDTGQEEDASGILAYGPTPPAAGYIDPMVTTAQGRKLAQNGMPAGSARAMPGGKLAQNALTQTYANPSASMAGVVTEPTGVRAGNVSIFSAHSPAPAPAPGVAMASTALDTPYPPATAVPSAGVNAMTRSVFSTGTPVACGNDANGHMISC
jgi:hypothetical protein